MSKFEIVDVVNFARGFPSVTQPEVAREHLLDTLDSILLNSKVDVLLVDGDEGVGKTVLLSQFAKRHSQNTISLFLRPASRAAIDPTYITGVLAEQLHWMLHGEVLQADVVSDSVLQTYFSALDRRLHRAQKKCFVVVDGLEDSGIWTQQFGQSVLSDLLPLGMSSYRHLIAGTADRIGKKLHRSLLVRSYYTALCSLDEAKRYLSDLSLASESIDELYRLSKKNFGKLANIRRLLQSGMDAQALLNDAPPDFLELEWQAIEGGPSEVKKVLSVIAYAQCPYDVAELAKVTKLSEADIRSSLEAATCLVVDPDTGEVSFCSEGHRRFIQRKLIASREEVLGALIKHHSDSLPPTQLTPLPQYLNEAHRYRELIAHLNTSYFLNVAEKTQSLTALQHATRLGVQSSGTLGDVSALIRFSAQAGFLNEMGSGETSQAEIEARIQLGDRALAISLAQRSSLREDRLALLVTVVAALKKYHQERDDTVVAQIVAMCDQVDFSIMKDRTIEIASELISVDPDLAFKILQRSAEIDDESSIDEAFAKLTFHALTARNDSDAAIATAEKAKANVKDPVLQNFFSSISLFLQTTSAADVIRHAESRPPSEALLFLRQWSEVTKAYDEAEAVLHFALDLLIRTTEYTPLIRDLRELSTPLRKIVDRQALKKLIARFDSVTSTVLDLGTSEELTRLRLHLAAGEARFDLAQSHQRLLELYWEISEVKDISAKAACLSWVITQYPEIDIDGSLQRDEKFLTVLQDDLSASLHELFRTSANHFEVAKGALRALARRDVSQALAVAGLLNTRYRRDQACLEIVRRGCRPAIVSIELDAYFSAIARIADRELKDKATSTLVAAFCVSTLDFGTKLGSALLQLFEACRHISQSLMRAGCLADLYDRIRRDGPDAFVPLQNDLLDDIETAWSSIDAGWRKATLAFQIARNLGKNDAATARLYVQRGEEVRKHGSIISESQFKSYQYLVRLASRALTGLLASGSEDGALALIAKAIDVIPSEGERAVIWADLASRAFLVGRPDCCEEIARERIRPLLEQIPAINLGARWRTEVRAAPALYAAHPGTALDRIGTFPQQIAEEAASNILTFLLQQTPLDDPYAERRSSRRRLKYEQLTDLFAILRHVSTDSLLYSFSQTIAERAAIKGVLTRQQMSDVAARIEREVLSRLPDPSNIQHEGYAIATLAYAGKLRQYTEPQWKALVERAAAVPNLADQAFVMATIAAAMGPRNKELAQTVLRDAKSLVESMPTNVDRIDRYLAVADASVDVDAALAKDCVKAAYTYACDDPDDNLIRRRRRALDLANIVDPFFAESLVAVVDDDPTRKLAKTEGQEQLRMLALEKALTVRDTDAEDLLDDDGEQIAQAAWRALGLLNADWVDPAHIDELRPYINVCPGLSLAGSSYPILAWVIENQLRRTAKSPAGKVNFSQLFHSLIQTTESAIAIIDRTSGAQQIVAPSFGIDSTGANGANVVIRDGERQKALDFLSNWASNAEGYIKVCDQYFGVGDLDLLRLLRKANSKVRIIVLTSRVHQRTTRDLDEHYVEAWRNSVSPHLPGDCDIVVVTAANNGEFPIHDRWCVSEDGGLRFGTSFNSLGISKVSEISVLPTEEAAALESEIDAILQRTRREHKGQRLSLSVVGL